MSESKWLGVKSSGLILRQKFDDRSNGSLVDLRKKIRLEERNCKVRHRDVYVGVATANVGRWVKRGL